MNNDEQSFYENIEKLKKRYKEAPKKTSKKLEKLLKELSINKKTIFSDLDFEMLYTVVIVIFIVLIGLINLSAYPIYIGGIVFFLAGIFVALYVSKFGLVFLFSHGLTGLFVMVASQIGSFDENSFANFLPLLSDNPSIAIYLYIGLGIIIFCAAFILTILHNLSDNFKNIKNIRNIILLLFAMFILMVGLFPYIARQLCSFHIF